MMFCRDLHTHRLKEMCIGLKERGLPQKRRRKKITLWQALIRMYKTQIKIEEFQIYLNFMMPKEPISSTKYF
jgi:hypothetical protein